MIHEIKVQTSSIVNIVGILLILKGIGILRSIMSNFNIFSIEQVSTSMRSFVYLILLIIPFIFLVKFFMLMQSANRNNGLIQLKDAFEQLKVYFLVLIISQIIRFGLDILTVLFI